ncbi:hypothetical protein BDN71DRAFT_1458751 [Pleurotus eryngii]|uniref:Uncharacterized protein n=1 Tax=Pleurotus eryngii TaxID=5323 RepID=A0A9P6D190_PLEER|nr:hypothetical protein BDN71DRAFT_1458751 [Pleurotus eryngii]
MCTSGGSHGQVPASDLRSAATRLYDRPRCIYRSTDTTPLSTPVQLAAWRIPLEQSVVTSTTLKPGIVMRPALIWARWLSSCTPVQVGLGGEGCVVRHARGEVHSCPRRRLG